jgi:hypothetical protein
VADEETTKVAQVSKGALDFPALAVTPQRSPILKSNAPAASMRTDQFDSTSSQALAKMLRIISAITDEPLRTSAGTPRSGTGHLHGIQGFFGKGDLRGRGAKESASQRNTLAVCHHHPLRTFATFGFTHAEPPFLAAAKLPSINTSLQLSFPCSSSSQRKSRHRVNHTSSSSQSRSLRQQVLALGYFLGRSRQRAPLRSTHRMPSRTARSSALGRPNPRGGGKRG